MSINNLDNGINYGDGEYLGVTIVWWIIIFFS